MLPSNAGGAGLDDVRGPARRGEGAAVHAADSGSSDGHAQQQGRGADGFEPDQGRHQPRRRGMELSDKT